ncbi:MAG: D-alanyl-D-alanine carboxypeptidase family protein [Lentisphaerae bacterium]|nr:MAG: D-alanyl-D-alanine carboxypeptidase family protein [Lentisphaerota bacterium]
MGMIAEESFVKAMAARGLSHGQSQKLWDVYQRYEIPVSFLLDADLPVFAMSQQLSRYQGTDGPVLVDVQCLEHLVAMVRAAEEDGIRLMACSAYRSYEYQAQLVQAKRQRGESWGQIFKLVAPPGCSEHHTGRAVDFVCPETLEAADPLTANFAGTSAYRWLCAHAGAYGFAESYPTGNRAGFLPEPWHWCWQSER